MVGDAQPVSLQQCARYGLKAFQRDIASGHAQDAYSFEISSLPKCLAARIFSMRSLTGLSCVSSRPGCVCEQLLGGQQRTEVRFAEPESGKLEGLTVAWRIVVAVA